ncbi:MAG: hypothetical protein J6V72_00340 [Kiritimatiellae bacterium]|nr:hypothetical protein [Kiritimatiellia bacterium]
MKTELAAFLIIVQTVSFLGCGEKNDAPVSTQSQVSVSQETLCGTNDLAHGGGESPTNGLAQTLKELDADFLSITNYVYAEWAGARDAALRMRDKIMTLPSDIGKVYAQNMLDRILSLPINHLGLYERTHALDSIWRMGNVVWWQGAREAAYCDILIGLLTKYRDSIEYARQEGAVSFVITASNNLNGRSRFYEKELAYRTSSKVPPQDYKHLVEEMSDEEYAVVKAKFEKFLGRPIRTYEEIVHEQMERSRQIKLERERRRGGPDVKVDVGDL